MRLLEERLMMSNKANRGKVKSIIGIASIMLVLGLLLLAALGLRGQGLRGIVLSKI